MKSIIIEYIETPIFKVKVSNGKKKVSRRSESYYQHTVL